MYSVQTGTWDPHPPSKHASPVPIPPPNNSRLAHVTSAAPAKRITFYKSGDNQFGGVRMAIHKRSFKCFDALLDDLSQKVPLPFGVRTVTTPRGTHTIKHLEQFQDGGCYLCSDQRHVKPIDMELATKRANIWYHHGRRPHRPETSSSTPPGHLHLPYRQRRILLVKNSEPGVRRSVILSRRSTRSLRAFLDEVSEVMQFHVRKLYTVEGRKIDNVQSLMTCPGVLVCVGREAFSPMLVNFIRKSSEEKMPGLGPRTPGNGARSPGTQGARSPPHGAHSRASECSEGLDSKKNVNFGLETKKSIIHPRSESSNRSARFSLSSEKSYSNGISAYSQARPAIMNDDIEKRVLVNKDGSLSVEMRVRFRLHNDESLQWSTQIKKSPSLTNESCPLSETQPSYLQQGQSESCSDPDCTPFDPEGMDYSSQQGTLEVNHCPCCYQRQEQKYDLWENPAHSHKHPPHPPVHSSRHTHTMVRHTNSSSSSSSCNSRRVVRCRARLSSCGGGSGSGQSQLVQEEMCLTEQVEHRVEVEQHGDTHVKVCKVSQSCNRSEVVTVGSNHRPLSGTSGCELMMAEEEERPLSAVSSSSRVLQSFKEDDEDDSLPPSASRCCNNCDLSPAPTPASQRNKPKTTKSEEEREAEDEDKETPRAVSGLSVRTGISKELSSVCPNCGGGKRGGSSRASQTSNHSNEANGSEDAASDDSVVSTQSNKTNLTDHGSISGTSNVVEGERAVSSLSVKSGASAKTAASVGSHKSNCQSSRKAQSPTGNTDVKVEDTNKRPSSCLSVKTNGSAKSGTPDRPASGLSAKSNVSVKSSKSQRSTCSHCAKPVFPGSKAEDEPIAEVNGKGEEEGKEERAASVISAKSNLSVMSNQSNKSVKPSNEKERAISQMSGKSSKSTNSPKSKCSDKEEAVEIENQIVEIQAQQRPKSGLSASARSSKSHKCNCNGLTEASSDTGEGEKTEERAASALSGKSASSAKSHHTNTNVEGIVDSASSVISGRSHNSAKSSKSQKSNQSRASQNPKNDIEENQERVASVMSAKSKSSVKSSTSHKSNSTKKPSSPNVVTINTPEEEDKETKSNHNGAAEIPTIETTDEEEKVVDDDAPKSISSQKFRGQTLSPRGTRSPRSHSSKATSPTGSQTTVRQLSPAPGVGEAKSPTSVKSGRSKCCCGATKMGDDPEDVKSEGGSERAASILSSSSKRPPASQNSLGSVSLVLPEDQDTADSDSGKSSVSICRDTGSKVRTRVRTTTPDVPKTPEDPTSKQDSERAGSSKSQKSNNSVRKSASSHILPVVDIPIIETPEGGENRDEEGDVQSKERAASAISAKSSRSHKSSCTCSVKEATQKLEHAANDPECESVKSASTAKRSNLDAPKGRTSSAMSSASAKIMRKSPASASAKNANGEKPTVSEVKGEDDTGDNRAAIPNSQSPCCLKPDSVVSAQSESKSKASKRSKAQEATKLDYLHPVKSHKARSSAESDNGSVKTSGSQKKTSDPCPVHSKVEASNESTLSAADLLKENMATAQPHSQQSKASKTSKKSDHCKKSRNQEEVLTPACLPNASPTEVVSDWLRSIPANSSMFAPDEEDEEQRLKETEEETPVKEVAEAEESPEDEKAGKEEEKAEAEEDERKEDVGVKCDEAEGKIPGDAAETSQTNNLRLSEEPPAKNWQSSAAVMKVLLSSSLGRCRSLPEVSPVYGRRLSTSAHRLLDCLAQLQLIEPAVNPSFDPQKDHNQQYEDIMAILHSLWLIEPRVVEVPDAKGGVAEQVTPPMSSSGVGMSNSSGGSGKENGNQGGDETPPNKVQSPQVDEAVQMVVEDQEGRDKETKASTEQAETNTADEQEQTEDQSTDPQSPDSPKTTNSPSSLDKSSANDDSKTQTDNEQEIVEDSSSGTPPTVLRAPLSKKLSQDPDPLWVLHLLKKLEKQFMSHYIDAMTEFKVRWDLDDSVILDTMICELREEVSRRIQTSVEREVKKIQGRAGRPKRSPRPPQLGNLSRESTMTDKRRRILKVMKNQSVKTGDSVSDGEMTGDFSDQRSDDEYCPCEACVRKKMAARPLKTNPLAAEAPVMMEFDLLKILQLKKSPIPTPPIKPKPEEVEEESVTEEEKERSLEVVQEEEEEYETKEDIKADVVLEETIAEEDEEVEQGQDEEEANVEEEGQEDGEKEENSQGDEVQDEGETGGEDNEENEIEEKGEEEEEEEEEGECQCHAANKEESDKEVDVDMGKNTDEEKAGEEEEDENAEDEEETGEEMGENEEEAGTGEDEEDEESDNNTVKEVSIGEVKNTENVEEEEDDEEVCEECKASESKEEEEESDSAGQDTTNDESTPAEELADGNVSASAEDEEEEEEGTAEGESHDDGKEGEDEEKQDEASEEENKEQNDAPCVTEGEEADGEDSDTDSKRQSDTGAEETGGTGDEEEEKEPGEDVVEEFTPEEDEEAEGNKGEDGALLHQITKTSVESQPGSLEDVDNNLPSHPVDSINVPKVGGGGGSGHRRSRSPARVKRRKPRENDNEDGNF